MFKVELHLIWHSPIPLCLSHKCSTTLVSQLDLILTILLRVWVFFFFLPSRNKHQRGERSKYFEWNKKLGHNILIWMANNCCYSMMIQRGKLYKDVCAQRSSCFFISICTKLGESSLFFNLKENKNQWKQYVSWYPEGRGCAQIIFPQWGVSLKPFHGGSIMVYGHPINATSWSTEIFANCQNVAI